MGLHCWSRYAGRRGQWAGIRNDNRQFINGVSWILRTGAPWRDLPPCYGKWGTVYQRFRRWQTRGYWRNCLQMVFYTKMLLSQKRAHFIAVSAKVDNANRRMQFIGGQTSKGVLHCGANYICNRKRGRAAVNIVLRAKQKMAH